jgi:hypothetical protein
MPVASLVFFSSLLFSFPFFRLMRVNTMGRWWHVITEFYIGMRKFKPVWPMWILDEALALLCSVKYLSRYVFGEVFLLFPSYCYRL